MSDAHELEEFAFRYAEGARPLTDDERRYLATEVARLDPSYAVEEALELDDAALCGLWRGLVYDEVVSQIP